MVGDAGRRRIRARHASPLRQVLAVPAVSGFVGHAVVAAFSRLLGALGGVRYPRWRRRGLFPAFTTRERHGDHRDKQEWRGSENLGSLNFGGQGETGV